MHMTNTGGRDIKVLRVKCNNDVQGCHWKGTIGTLQDHILLSATSLWYHALIHVTMNVC